MVTFFEKPQRLWEQFFQHTHVPFQGLDFEVNQLSWKNTTEERRTSLSKWKISQNHFCSVGFI
jgi:hypothetical protein